MEGAIWISIGLPTVRRVIGRRRKQRGQTGKRYAGEREHNAEKHRSGCDTTNTRQNTLAQHH